MHKEIADQWVAALRSDEYGQTYGYLREEFEPGQFAYCVLGVLCDLHRKATGGQWHGDNRLIGDSYLSAYSTLPSEVEQWAGISGRPELYSEELGRPESMSELNDGGKSFDCLADLIEEQWAEV